MKSDFEYLNSKYENIGEFLIWRKMCKSGVTNVAAIHLILVSLLPKKLYLRHR